MHRVLVVVMACLCGSQTISPTYAQAPEEIMVIGVVPGGAGLERDKIPFPVQSADSSALQNTNSLGLADFLRLNFASISLNDAQNNPLQTDLQYRGFTASPLLGLAQGIAVYQNGVRINEPLGDTVNWDLLPQTAVADITLSGGANPLFGLNSLGGSLIVSMKDGFSFEGTELELSSGSFGRNTVALQTGDNNGTLAYYANLEYLEDEGWRDHSSSEAVNFYGSIDWQSDLTRMGLHYQYSNSELFGNGAAPVELLQLDRAAIFTGPDITENNMQMVSFDFVHELSSAVAMRGNFFYRSNTTDSFNGDISEFAVCEFNQASSLLEGIEEDELESLGLDFDDICEGQFTDALALENFLNAKANELGEDTFNIQDLGSELSGTGVLSDEAINNISDRKQESTGADLQWSFSEALFGYDNLLIIGAGFFEGASRFDSVLELSDINPVSRLTREMGVGTYVESAATSIDTSTRSGSVYFTNATDLGDELTLTVSARANKTRVKLRDLSGERPELNGSHDFSRVNPAIGLTWQVASNHNLYMSYSESSRAPTPIELACNEGVFDLAVEFAAAAGEDIADVDFECRLPNAFLADPPLDDVIAKSVEVGARGYFNNINYAFGLFQTTNHDDILFQTTGRATGLFANVDKTRRRGFELSLNGQWQQLRWSTAYSYIDATFEDDFQALSPNHEFADDEGEIDVDRGDRIPGIPRHQFKIGTDYAIRPGFNVGIDLVSNDGQFIRGDESNQLGKVAGYTVINLRARYRMTEKLEIFAKVENLFDKSYESFGLLGENPGEVDLPVIENFSSPIFLGAAPPRAGFVGIRFRFQ